MLGSVGRDPAGVEQEVEDLPPVNLVQTARVYLATGNNWRFQTETEMSNVFFTVQAFILLCEWKMDPPVGILIFEGQKRIMKVGAKLPK